MSLVDAIVAASVTNTESMVTSGSIISKDYSAEIPVNQTVDFFTTERPTRIDYLEWSTDARIGNELVIEFRKGDSLIPLRYVGVDGKESNVRLVPSAIVDEALGFCDILNYDTEKNEYKFKFSKPLMLPEGGRIYFRNLSSTVVCNNAAYIYGVEL